MNIKIPHVADGITSGTVVSLLVKVGDQVKKDQTVLELETDKAIAPVPATDAGTITAILVKEGDKVSIGQAVMTMSESGAATKSAPNDPEPLQTPSPLPAAVHGASAPAAAAATATYQSKSGFPPPASPTIRKMAIDLGIDLTRVPGSEAGGRIVLADLRNYILRLQQSAASVSSTQASGASSQAGPKPAQSIDFSKWGTVTKKSPSNLRKKIGEKMAESWTTIPHVTQFDEADITDMMALRKKYNPAYEKDGGKLTVTVLLMKVVVDLLKKYPGFNTSLDEVTQELIEKNYYNLGIAVDTEQGLIVPVIRNVDQKNLLELSKELSVVAEKTRQRKVGVDDLQGGTFTISNLGSIGGTHFTPIVNKPEVAILGIGRGVLKPVTKDGKIESRLMLPLCLSYDHRVVDGGDGARFISGLVEGLEKFNEDYLKISSKAKASAVESKKLVKVGAKAKR